MKYRLLWGAAVAGLALHLAGLGWDVANHSSHSGLSAPSQMLALGGIGLMSAALLASLLFWGLDRALGSESRSGVLLRSVAVPSVALAAAGAIWIAASAQDIGLGESARGVSIAEAALHSDPILVANDTGAPAAAGAAAAEAAPHAHTAASPAAPGAKDAASPMGEGNAHTHGTESPVSAAQLAAASTFVAEVKASTAKYEDIRVAMADGYTQITQDLPGIAAHFMKPALLADSVTMDPTKPEFLLYTKRLDGNWRLVGTMFYAGPGADAAPNYFGALDAWHLHENLCFVVGGVRSTPNPADCKGGLFVRKTNWQLHVWTVDDADGVFAHDYSKIAPGAFPAATKSAAQDVLVRAQ